MNTQYEQWLAKSLYKEELAALTDLADIEDRFYQFVPFGTGGMRGKLGAGCNRINIHTIRLVAEGLARQVEKHGELAKVRGVVIAYDTRHFSSEFAYETAGVLAAHGIQSYVFRESRPTPELSFAVRYLNAYAGVVITASHNPKQYNGFKVYGEDGAQLTPQFADAIEAAMRGVDDLFAIEALTIEELRASGLCVEILEQVDDAYAGALQSLVRGEERSVSAVKDLPIVYTSLHGAGLVPTMRALREANFANVHVVEEQAVQDGAFPTVVYPNPEEASAFALAMEKGREVGAQLLLATDPDADRLGVAVRDGESYTLLNGNELGALLLHFLLSEREVPKNAAMVKTIVTSELGAAIATHFGAATVNTLTGFKFIAEKIAEWEQTKEYSFIFGYEESYGYLAGDFVRDKDAVQIALLVAEMAYVYIERGQTLLDGLAVLYEQFGYYKEALISKTYDGLEGRRKIQSLMKLFREQAPSQFAGILVAAVEDYAIGGVNGLPKADVVKFRLVDGSWICVRPSGTEPKCKFYFGVCCESEEASLTKLTSLKQSVEQLLID